MNSLEKSAKVALIAGGAGGMGIAIAERLGLDGFQVVLADLSEEALAVGTTRLGQAGVAATAIQMDIRDTTGCNRAIDTVIGSGAGLQVLVNAAGVWREGPSSSVTDEDWDLVMGVNLKGPFNLIRAALPHMQRGASIVNIASDAGVVGNKGAAIYCASKGGLVLLTKALALELAPQGIRVNAVCPADVATPMIEFQAEQYGGGDPEAYKADLLAHYPQGRSARFISPKEVARMVSYLCHEDADPVTGTAMMIDFGLTAGY